MIKIYQKIVLHILFMQNTIIKTFFQKQSKNQLKRIDW